jgi:aminoglycoside phosphotransferase (APT) family kinase protein
MMQGDELMMIDMGEVGYGHPLLDLGHAYSAMVTFVGEDYDKVIGLPREMGIRFYERALEYYFEGLDAAEFAHRKEQIATVSTVRGVSWLSLSDSFPAFVIQNSKEQFVERVVKQKDKLLAICETFKDWKV